MDDSRSEISTSNSTANIEKETEKNATEDEHEDVVDQESVSLEQIEDLNSEKSDTERSDHSRSDTDDASVILEREEGDGQESTPNRKVDDDEDKRNPQYIPKRGTFYEHDDRTATEDGVESTENNEKERCEKDTTIKKKVWSDKENSRWSHDRYNDQEQAPKSKAELISIYGYDIRNEEGPPRARRRRRYGRGPNKYTRNWEDEEAYTKPTGVVTKVPPRKNKIRSKREEFPPLVGERNQQKPGSAVDNKAASFSPDATPNSGNEKDEVTVNRIELSKNDGPNISSTSATKKVEQLSSRTNENGEQQQRGQKTYLSPRKDIKPSRNMLKSKPEEMGQGSGNMNSRGITKSRGFKSAGRMTESNRNRNQKSQHQYEEYSDYIMSQNFTNKTMSQQQNVQELEKDMSSMSVQDSGYSGRGGGGKFSGGPRQTTVPPRLQAEQRGSKRYSSLCQRSLPETVAPNFNQHTAYYPAEYNQQNAQQQTQQGLLPHPSPSIHSQVPSTNTQQMITVAPTNQPIGAMAHQGPPTNGAPPLLPAPPPQYAQPYPQPPPAFIQTGVAPPPFIPQQAPPPQILNYAQPPQFTQPTAYTNYQHQQYNPVNQGQPTELYQPQGGITYYSTQNQQVMPRIATKRPKAAIPIVPPPEHKEQHGRGRGRLNQGDDSPVGGTPDIPQTSTAENYMEQQQQQPQQQLLPDNGVHYHQQDNSVVVQQ